METYWERRRKAEEEMFEGLDSLERIEEMKFQKILNKMKGGRKRR